MDGGHVHHLGPLHRPVQACGRFSSVGPVQGVGPGFSCLVVEVEPVPHLNQPTRRSKVMWRYIYMMTDPVQLLSDSEYFVSCVVFVPLNQMECLLLPHFLVF